VSQVGPAALLAALTAVAFTAPFETLATDQRISHHVAWVAAALILAAVTRPRTGADAALLLANSATLWLVIDRLVVGDLLATVTAAAVPAVTIAFYAWVVGRDPDET
jgi:hypothetical protein